MLRHPSRLFVVRLSLGALSCALGTTTLAAFQPAAAATLIAKVDSLVKCSTSAACVTGTNASNGAGVSGTSTNGFGVVAASTNASGIYTKSTKSNGIFAYSANSNGVEGSSAKTYGVFGSTGGTSGNTAGVWGEGAFTGVLGTTTNSGISVSGITASGDGVWGQASSGGVGTGGQSYSGYGVYASSATGTALRAYSAQGTGIRSDIAGGGFSVVGTSVNGQGAGADFEGGRYGIVGRAQSSGYPLVLTDSSLNNVFYVTGTGDIYYSGNFYTFARTGGGGTVSSFTAKSTEPTVEDTGSAHLTAGFAAVRFDSSFAAAVDKSASYRVFITPDGDTRGLFVAQKTPRGFIVRETQGGRSNLAFDYRIVATSQGGVGKRMALASAHVAPDAPAAPREAPLQIKSSMRSQPAMP